MQGNSVDSEAVILSLGLAAKEIHGEFDTRLARIAMLIDGQAKKNIQTGSRSGRRYTRRSISHQASSAGEYPKTDTGALARNIFWEKVSRLNYKVGSRGKGAPHGFWLEFGTIHMAARPWLNRTIKENVDKIAKILYGSRL